MISNSQLISPSAPPDSPTPIVGSSCTGSINPTGSSNSFVRPSAKGSSGAASQPLSLHPVSQCSSLQAPLRGFYKIVTDSDGLRDDPTLVGPSQVGGWQGVQYHVVTALPALEIGLCV